MIRRPPRSTLFPYPPLSRSLLPSTQRFPAMSTSHDTLLAAQQLAQLHAGFAQLAQQQLSAAVHGQQRSEEHTSELQSPCNLVCRLLLEKKKKNKLLLNVPLSTSARSTEYPMSCYPTPSLSCSPML